MSAINAAGVHAGVKEGSAVSVERASAASGSMDYLTSIRGLAALLVVLFHVRHLLPGTKSVPLVHALLANGYLAVDFFLVLSGFILSYKYAADFKNGVRGNFREFFAKRLARIYPLHAFVMLCFLVLPAALYITGRGYDAVTYAWPTFTAKFFLFDLWLFRTQAWDTWNVPSWTISGELFAYLLFPVFVHLYQRWGLGRRVLFLAAAMVTLVGSYAAHGCASIGECIAPLGLVRCSVEFLFGVYVWFLFAQTRNRGQAFFRAVMVASLAVWVFAASQPIPNYLFVPPVFAATLYGLLGWRSRLHQALEWRWLVYLGEISYSVYLNHLLFRDGLYKVLVRNGQPGGLEFVLVYVVVTVLCSIVTYRYVELPARRVVYGWLARKTRERKPTWAAAGASGPASAPATQ